MTKGVWNSPGEIRSDFKCKVFPPSPFSPPTSCYSSENGTVFKEAIFAEQRWMLFLLQISRFFSRSNLICKWKWLYLPCRYRSYVGNSWKFMFWTYLQKKKNRPCLYFWLRLAPLKKYQWGSVYLLNYYIVRANGSEPEAVFSCAPWTSRGLGSSKSPQRYEKRYSAVSSL